jgi:hypothetical protein
LDFRRHGLWSLRAAEEGALAHQRGARPRVPLAHRRPDYPLSDCVPAEPESVSPGGVRVTIRPAGNKSNGPKPA